MGPDCVRSRSNSGELLPRCQAGPAGTLVGFQTGHQDPGQAQLRRLAERFRQGPARDAFATPARPHAVTDVPAIVEQIVVQPVPDRNSAEILGCFGDPEIAAMHHTRSRRHGRVVL